MPKVTPLEERYRWAPNAGSTGRYQDRATGRYVSELSVRGDLDKYIDAKNANLDALANQLRNREISLADWQIQMRNEMRNMHNAAAMVAKGGRDQMTYADWGRVGQRLRFQYGKLDDWAAQIARGEAPLDGRLAWRARLYGQAARGTYEQQRRAMAAEKGNDEEMRILHAKESCAGCIENAGHWEPIGTLPDIGKPGVRNELSLHLRLQARAVTLLTMWLDVRDAAGKLLFRFDPQRDLVQVGERGRVIVVDLSQYREQEERKMPEEKIMITVTATQIIEVGRNQWKRYVRKQVSLPFAPFVGLILSSSVIDELEGSPVIEVAVNIETGEVECFIEAIVVENKDEQTEIAKHFERHGWILRPY